MKKNNIFLTIFIYLLVTVSLKGSEQKIKLYSFYTPSHKVFLDNWFLPSLQDDFDIVLECWDQDCFSAEFRSQGWITTMLHKVDLIIRGIKENWHKIFIHADVDIQFFAPVKNIILHLMDNDKDMLIQRDSPEGYACAGFFACRGNERTLALWKKIKEHLSDDVYMKEHPKTDDQAELNRLMGPANQSKARLDDYNISWDYLPKEFLSGGSLTGVRWSPGQKLSVPKNILLHHANWTIGINNKIEQLKYVKSLVESTESTR